MPAVAYGLEISSDFSIPSLATADASAAPELRLESVPSEQIDRRVAGSEGRCVELIEHPDGEIGLRIDEHPGGYRMEVGAFGRYFLGFDPAIAYCAPLEVEAWRRERFLVARVLPIAALLAGYEIIHASAVAVGGSGIAVLGHSGAGKSSLALRLGLAGLPILTDDLLSLSIVDGEVLAHPGTRLIGIRAAEHRLLSEEERGRLGAPIDRGDKYYGRTELAAGPVPLRLLYSLRRNDADHEGPLFTSHGPPDPKLLLGATFFARLELTEPRLVRQLDVYRQLARQAESFTVEVPAGLAAAELAGEIERHAAGRLGELHPA